MLRHSPLRRRSDKSAARHAAQFGPQAELCRKGPCQACGRAVRCDPHHEPYRSHGGKDEDTCALCTYGLGGRPGCHWKAHKMGRPRFEVWCGRTVQSMVEEMRARLAARGGVENG